jgi:hypothetical protein
MFGRREGVDHEVARRTLRRSIRTYTPSALGMRRSESRRYGDPKLTVAPLSSRHDRLDAARLGQPRCHASRRCRFAAVATRAKTIRNAKNEAAELGRLPPTRIAFGSIA